MEEMKADGEDLVTDNRNNEGLDDDFWWLLDNFLNDNNIKELFT